MNYREIRGKREEYSTLHSQIHLYQLQREAQSRAELQVGAPPTVWTRMDKDGVSFGLDKIKMNKRNKVLRFQVWLQIRRNWEVGG